MFRTPIVKAWSTFVKHLSPQNVIYPVKMTPIHKVWIWSLGGQGVILTGAGMFRTPIFISWSTFVKHLSPQNDIFPVKMTPSLKVCSWSLGGQGVILTEAGMFRTPVFIVLSRCHGQKSVCIGLGAGSASEKFPGWVVGGTVKITSAPGPDHLILN